MLRTRRRERVLLTACIAARHRFVVDNTNPTREDRQRYIVPARQAGFRIIGYYFQSCLRDCLARDLSRPDAEQVPEAGIRATSARLEIPSLDEGFDALWYVRLTENHGSIVEEWRDEVQ